MTRLELVFVLAVALFDALVVGVCSYFKFRRNR